MSENKNKKIEIIDVSLNEEDSSIKVTDEDIEAFLSSREEEPELNDTNDWDLFGISGDDGSPGNEQSFNNDVKESQSNTGDADTDELSLPLSYESNVSTDDGINLRDSDDEKTLSVLRFNRPDDIEEERDENVTETKLYRVVEGDKKRSILPFILVGLLGLLLLCAIAWLLFNLFKSPAKQHEQALKNQIEFGEVVPTLEYGEDITYSETSDTNLAGIPDFLRPYASELPKGTSIQVDGYDPMSSDTQNVTLKYSNEKNGKREESEQAVTILAIDTKEPNIELNGSTVSLEKEDIESLKKNVKGVVDPVFGEYEYSEGGEPRTWHFDLSNIDFEKDGKYEANVVVNDNGSVVTQPFTVQVEGNSKNESQSRDSSNDNNQSSNQVSTNTRPSQNATSNTQQSVTNSQSNSSNQSGNNARSRPASTPAPTYEYRDENGNILTQEQIDALDSNDLDIQGVQTPAPSTTAKPVSTPKPTAKPSNSLSNNYNYYDENGNQLTQEQIEALDANDVEFR